MQAILTNVIAFFVMMIIGFGANRIGVLPNESNKYLVDLLMKITCPCMILSTTTSQALSEDTFVNAGIMLLGSILFFALFYFISWVFCVKIMKIKPEEGAGVYMMIFTTVNNGFIGFPITKAIFGDEMMFWMVFFQIILMLYLYSAGIIQTDYGYKPAADRKAFFKKVINPSTVCAAAGLILLALGVHLPEMFKKAIDSVGNATTPISMIVIGIQLGSSNFNKVIKNKKLVITSIVKMISCPLITLLIVHWLPIPSALKITLVFGATFPAAVAVVPIASMEGKDAVLGAEGVAFTTLLSIATMPMVAYLLTMLYL